MIVNQKFILFVLFILNLIVNSNENEINEEEPILLAVSKDIMEKKTQTITLIFQNSQLDPKGFQSIFLRENKNNTLYKLDFSCSQKIYLADNLMSVNCELNLSSSEISFGSYVVESFRYKNMYFLNNKVIFEIEKNKDNIEFIGTEKIYSYPYMYFYPYFNYDELVDTSAIKSVKIANEQNEYEFSFKKCYYYVDHISCEFEDLYIEDKIVIGEYNVEYIIYKNEKLKPKYNLKINCIIENPYLLDFKKEISKEKGLELYLGFLHDFVDEIEFYFREINHSYINYKIESYPKGEWTRYGDDYKTRYEFFRIFVFNTEYIPTGNYVLEYVYQKARFETNYEFKIVNKK